MFNTVTGGHVFASKRTLDMTNPKSIEDIFGNMLLDCLPTDEIDN